MTLLALYTVTAYAALALWWLSLWERSEPPSAEIIDLAAERARRAAR